jgi:hypothetical protein
VFCYYRLSLSLTASQSDAAKKAIEEAVKTPGAIAGKTAGDDVAEVVWDSAVYHRCLLRCIPKQFFLVGGERAVTLVLRPLHQANFQEGQAILV